MRDLRRDSEAEIVDSLGLEVVTLADVRTDPVAAADRALARAAAHDELLMHVDIDVLSWVEFPIAENSRRRDGLLLTELREVLIRLVGSEKWRARTWCEVNPDHAPDEGRSFAVLVEVWPTYCGLLRR